MPACVLGSKNKALSSLIVETSTEAGAHFSEVLNIISMIKVGEKV